VFLYYMRADCPALFIAKDLKALGRLCSTTTMWLITSPWMGNPVEGERDSGLKLNAIPL